MARTVAWNLSWVVTASVGGAIVHHWRELWARLAPAGLEPSAAGVHDGYALVMSLTIALYVAASGLYYLLFRNHRANRPVAG